LTTPLRPRRLAILAAAALSALSAAPRPTPTPEPRLTGGFGKTPVAAPPHRSGEKKKLRITNESLVTEADKGKLTTSDVRNAPKPTPTRTPAGRSGDNRAEAAAPAAPAEPAEGGEEYWRGEARRLRERVAALDETIARLEGETKKLESDFYSWDDGAYRDGVIKPAWDKAREELATARKELPVARKELDELSDRARRAGALPGWLRE
jgi:hypothetical protein